MCNYFGGHCTGPTDDDLKRYSDQANREYQAMMAQYRPTREQNERLAEALKPDPRCYKPSRIKKGYLTQEQIDNGPQETPVPTSRWSRAWGYLEGVPGWMLTVAAVVTAITVIICFIYLFGGPVPVPTGERG